MAYRLYACSVCDNSVLEIISLHDNTLYKFTFNPCPNLLWTVDAAPSKDLNAWWSVTSVAECRLLDIAH